MSKFCFVVLHYKTWWDTIECVDSMLETTYQDKHIIIVNNDEDDVSQKKLLEAYSNNKLVSVIDTKENLGFSKGHNVGFTYAKQQLNAEYIVLSNNDIIIPDENLIEKVINKYQTNPFHIYGPKIISTVDNCDQNPRDELYDSIENVKKFISNFKRLLWLNYFHLDVWLVSLKKKLLPKSKLPSYSKNIDHENEQWGVKLHGCFLVFSKKYILEYDGLYPLRSMQMEESILNFIAKRDNLKTCYDPSCTVFHKEDSATNYVYGKGVHKRRFYYRNCIQSCKVLLKLMENEE